MRLPGCGPARLPSLRCSLWSGCALVLAALLRGGGPVPAQAPEPGSEAPLALLWSRPQPSLVAMALSPGGERILVADANGWTRCFEESGALRWERTLPGTDHLAISRDGTLALACTLRSHRRRTVSLLDARGRRIHVLEAPGAIEAAVVAPDGTTAGIAAGDRVILVLVDDAGVRTRTFAPGGTIRRLQPGPKRSVYAASPDNSLVALVAASAGVVWRRHLPGGRLTSLSSSLDGASVALATDEGGERVSAVLLSSANELVWTASRPGRNPRLRLSASGNCVLLAYEHQVRHQQECRYERRMAYLTSGNTPGRAVELWTKGGAFTAPLHVAVEAGGDWLVALDIPARGRSAAVLRLMDRDGVRKYTYAGAAPLLISLGSAEGRHVACFRGDGRLELVHVGSPASQAPPEGAPR